MKTYRIYCDQCSALAINGTACHEHGCPNRLKPWKLNEDTQRIEPSCEQEQDEFLDEEF